MYASTLVWVEPDSGECQDGKYAEAQFNLGFRYVIGEGVPQDDTEAMRWWGLAAEQGHAVAQSNLGVVYDTGRGVPQDDVQAHMWYNLAASRSTGEKRENAVKFLDQVANRLTPEDRSEAQRLARAWDAAHPRELERHRVEPPASQR